MNPDAVIQAVSPPIGALGAAFYFTPATLAKGKELGLDGFRFYFIGRGGVLGDVEPPVVASAFGYFNPGVVERMWTTARAKIEPREAARVYLGCCQAMGRDRLSGVDGLDAFCAAADAVDAAAEPAGLALYAGIAAEPRPDDVAARALQMVAVLRELRGSAHLLAVRAAGLTPQVAHYLRRPDDYASFGWGDPPAVTDVDRQKLAEADVLTDQLLVPAYSTLDDAGADALVAGVGAIEAALK